MIKYLQAEDGALVLSTEIVSGKSYVCRTPHQVARALQAAGGVDEKDLLHSSSVDFANEYGFRSAYGAYDRWQKGLALYRKQLEKQKK
jgi:hypothetical protein